MFRKTKAKKCIRTKLNNLMVLTCLAILAICYLMTKTSDKTSLTESIEPSTIAHLEDGSTEYFFTLKDYNFEYSGIMFYSSHQLVQAYYAGNQIYSFDKTGGFWGSTPGSVYNIIEVNENMNGVVVRLTPVYDIVADERIDFYIGSTNEILMELVSKSVPKFIVSIMIIMFSLLLFAYYYLMHKKQHLGRELVHLAYFALFLGLWTATETDLAVLIIKNRIFDSIIPYVSLMLSVPPFILFFDSYLEIRSRYLKRYIIWASMAQFVILTALHLLKIKEYRETLFVTQTMLLIAVVYMVVGVIVQIVKKNRSRHIRVCAVGLTMFLIATIFDIVKYYKGIGDADMLGRYLFLIFVVLLAWDLIRSTYEIIEKGRRAKQLEVFALTDSMTGLYNRNAFESQAKSEKDLMGITVVVADANGLKMCNDTFGHEAGDKYITTVADSFNKVYGRYGDCYRTGGDEFCCIIPASHQTDMESLKTRFMSKICDANIKCCHDFTMGVAIGSARFDEKVDKDFRSLVKRADASMYENKRNLKKLG